VFKTNENTISEEFSVTNFFLHKSNFGMFKAACLFKSTKYLAGQAIMSVNTWVYPKVPGQYL
jgi:hypothetical protein